MTLQCAIPAVRIADMNLDSAYQAALDYIYSFVEFSRTHQENLAPENYDLSRMRALMNALGNPDQGYKKIHVAGTKGKGSVSAFCATALQEAGLKTGLYTSPHLKDFEERIQINRKSISRADLITLVDEIRPYVAAIQRLTTFEISTALSFLYFARQNVDIAVIEVGLGGRLDATNVITPLVSVITSISRDHTYVLGDSLAEIAAEKGGIIKPGIPVVLAPQRQEPRQTLVEIAAQRGCPLTQIGRDYKFSIEERSLDGQTFSLWRTDDPNEQPISLGISLLGDHQAENCATAYATLQVVKRAGIDISEGAIRQGMAETFWAGRFEILQLDPPVIIDAAHNAYSARILENALDQYFPNMPMILITGMSADKDVQGMIDAWLPRTAHIITTQSGHPRAIPPEELREAIRAYTDIPTTAKPNATAALNAALEIVNKDQLIIATGSVFEVASIRIAWMENQKEEIEKANKLQKV
jgi:dihydrofolate synthase/folylpolyglutamate synthase